MERLAQKSVIFDNAYCQVSVCNPSRDSMLTGLRPDTTGTYSFQWTFRPLMVFPTQLTRSGYNTRGIGKILHWETDPNVWNHQFKADWYDFQNTERNFMNSTTMPDKKTPEQSFRDYMFATKTIDAIKELHTKNEHFLVSVGFKLPHLSMHVPWKYYEMYRNKKNAWALTKQERQFPASTPLSSYRCCAEGSFRYMNEEGAKPSLKEISLDSNIDLKTDFIIPEDMRDELMMGYWGGISFLDAQIGRILDTIDELKLWNNLTIVFTADHGIHNGEKGLW
jgi:iduronate 2-sulfatase